MSVNVRPINSQDISLSYGEVKNLIGSGINEGKFSSNVESVSIFGSALHDGEEDRRYEDPYTHMGHIKLALPVLNPFLAGEDGYVWQKIINSDIEPDIADVVRGNKFYNVKEGKAVHVSNLTGTYSERDWLVGGQYLRKLIDEMDVEKEIEDLIYDTYVYPTLRNQKVGDEEYTETQMWRMFKIKFGKITRGSGACWILDDYYYTAPEDRVDYPYGDLEYIVHTTMKDELTQHMNRLVLLLALRDNKSRFRDQVQDIVFVLPIGYRPRIEGGPDPLTKQYNYLVKANNDLREVISYSNIDIKTVQSRYKELYNRVVNIMIGCKTMWNSESYKPLMETLGHKSGLIRNNMQATRVDYSGRTVIVSDPTMPLDYVGVPKAMCEKLCELEILEEWNTKAENKAYIMSKKFEGKRIEMAARLLEDEMVVIGRQPTLYYLGIQGMKVKVVEGNALVLSPLVTQPYNADFDGDQMHVNKPITEEAKREVRNLMQSTNNLFYPKNGEITVVPRHEILYGLYIASTVKNGRNQPVKWSRTNMSNLINELGLNSNVSISEAVFEGVCKQLVNVYDTVNVPNTPYDNETAGIVAIKFALGSAYANYVIGVNPITTYGKSSEKDKAVTVGWCKSILQHMAETGNKSYFVDCVNKLVKLGFAVAEIYPPSISMTNAPDVREMVEEFDRVIKKREELFNRGFETEEAFSSFYSKEYSALEKKAKKVISDMLGPDSGWKSMVDSGAKGSLSNLLQLFGFKGRMMKDQRTAFNAIVKSSLNEGLSQLEHGITSYGSRQGIIDKVVATDKPGYLSRKITHTAANISVTEEDCGTEDGLLLTYWDIRQFIPEYQLTKSELYNSDYVVKPYFCKILSGRYVQPGSVYVPNEKEAEAFYDMYVARSVDGELEVLDGIVMRSPITCDNPCCAKCYGRDLSTMSKEPAVGTPIGYIAAQSIGEPGTQLTMKNFQKGGVAGAGGLTSSFDKVNDYMHLHSLRKGSVDDPISYDFISPISGDVEEVHLGNGTKEVKILAYGKDGKYKNRLRSKLVVFEDIALKSHVEKGESIQLVQGDLDIREIMKERSIEEAQKYLTLVLYDTFKNEVDVNIKHFEVVVAGMTYLVCVASNDYFKTGSFYTMEEANAHDTDGAAFFKTLKGIKEVPKYKNDFFSTIFMENIGESVRRSIVLNPHDEMKNPIVRMSFGMFYGLGSDVDSYITERGQL